jgi:hypothetical protein
MGVSDILFILMTLAITGIAIQVMINNEQNKINKAISDYIALSNEKFDQIDQELAMKRVNNFLEVSKDIEKISKERLTSKENGV